MIDQHLGPNYYIAKNTLHIKPGVNPELLSQMSHRQFEGIEFDGEYSDENWTKIFAATESFKKTGYIIVTRLQLDKNSTNALSSLPQADSLVLSNSRIDFDSLIRNHVWSKYAKFSLEKIDPIKTCKNDRIELDNDNILRAMGANNHFVVFTITRMRFSAAGLKSLLSGAKAEGMNFGRCRISPEMLKDICQCPSLKTLVISEQFYTFEQVKQAVTSAPTLKTLSLSRQEVKPEIVQAVRKQYPHFKDPSTHWTAQEIAAIKKLGVNLEFKDSAYVFVPAFDEWRAIKEVMALN